MNRRPRLRSRASLTLILALTGLTASPALAQPQAAKYSDEDATACIDCHETPTVMAIFHTAHAIDSDPRTPAAQKQCQSCHGPSATHMRFPMQVENVHFGEKSRTKAEVQNQLCLECHQDGDRESWQASAHGFETVLCNKCHGIHDPNSNIPTNASLTKGCTESCHQDLMHGGNPSDFTHATGKPLNGMGELTCAGCHNPHGPLSSQRCLECHEQTPENHAKESAKAQRYHEVAREKGTTCIRCHKGIAHPIGDMLRDQLEAEASPAGGD